MFRTRDFVLYLTSVVFLLMAIGTTTVYHKVNNSNQLTDIKLAPGSDKEYSAVIVETPALDRADKLAEMRKKIAGDSQLALANSVPAVDPIEPEEVTEEDSSLNNETAEEVGDNISPQTCPNYKRYQGQWSASGLMIEVVEGARIVYREVAGEIGGDLTDEMGALPGLQKEVLVQLPIRNVPSLNSTCLTIDVVGIAKDGSLIRNDELALYGVFSEITLIGYALDGFPIHGKSDAITDACGGSVKSGEYRYYLSDDRSHILNCFSAPPVIFP